MRAGMFAYLGRRLLQSILVLWVVVTLLFLLFRLGPSNPLVAYIDTTFTAEQQEALIKQFGLDKSLPEQYFVYLGNLLLGELGDSFTYRKPVVDVIWAVLPNTVYLTLTSLFFAYLVGVASGIFLAWRRGSHTEGAGVVAALMTRAAPEFWVGMILLSVFSFQLGWFPSSGISEPGVLYTSESDKLTSPDFWWHMALPAFASALHLLGLPLLLMRSNMLEVMQDDFITMGRLAGYTERRLMVRHAARNALLPVATALALGIGYSIGGDVVIENVFGWPGLGRTLVKAVSSSDYPLAQGAFLYLAAIMIFMNFVADIMYGLLDPRVGSTERANA